MNHTDPTAPIRRSELPPIPPPEWDFHTWFPLPDGGGDLVPGQLDRGVHVRRLVTYGDWEPVRPDRWADEPETDCAAASAVVSPPTGRADDVAAAIASCPGYEMRPSPCRCPCYGCKHHCGAHNPRVADEEQTAAEDDALATARATNQRLNLRAQHLESELAAYRRAVRQWEVSERGTYIPHSSLRAIGKACGMDILGSVRHLKHFERVEQAEAAIERVRAAVHIADDEDVTDWQRGYRACAIVATQALDEPTLVAQQPATEARPGLRERHRAAWNALTPAEQDARIAALDAIDADEQHCVCGAPIELQDENDSASWIHCPGSDTPCLNARPAAPPA